MDVGQFTFVIFFGTTVLNENNLDIFSKADTVFSGFLQLFLLCFKFLLSFIYSGIRPDSEISIGKVILGLYKIDCLLSYIIG